MRRPSDLDGPCAPAYASTLVTSALATLRRLGGLLSPALGLIFLCSLVLAAAHHHTGNAESHACVVCTAGHVPAVTTTAAASSPAPALLPERVDSPLAELPSQARLVTVSSRAPPLA